MYFSWKKEIVLHGFKSGIFLSPPNEDTGLKILTPKWNPSNDIFSVLRTWNY